MDNFIPAGYNIFNKHFMADDIDITKYPQAYGVCVRVKRSLVKKAEESHTWVGCFLFSLWRRKRRTLPNYKGTNIPIEIGDIISAATERTTGTVICLGGCSRGCYTGWITIRRDDGFGNTHAFHNNMTSCWFISSNVLTLISKPIRYTHKGNVFKCLPL